jgi:microcystin-dependent protein
MANLKLKENLDIANSLNVLPFIGYIMPFAGNITQTASGGTITTTAPPGWLLCNGNVFSSTLYPELFSILDSDILPNLSGRYLVGYYSNVAVATTGGANTHTHGMTSSSTSPLSTYTPAAHNHTFPGYTVAVSSHSHNHSMSGSFYPGNNDSNVNAETSTGTVNAVPFNHNHPLTGNTAISGSNSGNITHDHDTNSAGVNATSSTGHAHNAGAVTATEVAGSSIPQTLYLNYIIKADF